jgi:hypothetical protein
MNVIDKLKTKNYVFIILIAFCITNCSKQFIKSSNINNWDEAKIDSLISKDLIYKKLDTQKEILSDIEDEDVSKKRTSDVTYLSGKK